jgi:hypothetical protein
MTQRRRRIGWVTGNRKTLRTAFLSRHAILLRANKTRHRNRQGFAVENRQRQDAHGVQPRG